jgi:hypothetical protein
MHVYLVTGVAFTIAIGILISLIFGISVDTLATMLKWSCGFLLVVGIVGLHRRSKRSEDKQERIARQIQRYRGGP